LGGLLDQTSEFEGTLKFGDSLRIDGRFRGVIESQGVLIIGEKADVTAEIRVGSLSVAGTVRGAIKTSDRLEIFSGGKVHCDVVTPSIRIEEGALFHGSCETVPRANASRTEPSVDMAKVGRQLGA